MKARSFRWNKKKVLSLLMASGITLCNIGNAEIYSYNYDVKLKDGRDAKLYFSKKIGDINCAYISSGNMVGFIYEDEVIMNNNRTNNYFIEDNSSIPIVSDVAYMYQTPEIDDIKVIGVLNKDTVVDIIAKTNDGWYCVYANGISGFMHESSFIKKNNENMITVLKPKKNNVNVRYSATTKKDNIIGFADTSDTFKIIGKEDNWYIIDYLGEYGYIRDDLAKEIEMSKTDLEYTRIAYLSEETYFNIDLNNNYGTYLPAYQNVKIIDEINDYYKVNVDGVIGYISKNKVKRLSHTCVVVDLARQVLKVFKNGNEIYRAHIISGRESLQTQIGCFKIGHKVKGYQLTPENYVDYWIQYDDNRGIHDASWQSDKNFQDIAYHAYENYSNGYGKTYPYKHGSHGCNNMKLTDVMEVYSLVNVNDNVLVIGPNNLIKENLISKRRDTVNNINSIDKIKVKRLV